MLHITDEHYPYTIPCIADIENPKKETPFLRFLKDYDPHIVVQGGDQMDLGVIAHWNKGKPLLKEGKRLLDEYKKYNIILDEREKRMKNLEKWIMFEGNHEFWINNLIEEQPEILQGFIEIEANLRIDSRGIKWIKSRQHWRMGHAYFIHGDYKDGYLPVYAAKAVANIYGRSVFFGHQHKNSVYSGQTPFDEKPIQVTGVGCLCNLNPAWRRNQPSDWMNSFVTMQVDEKNGNFYHQVVNIINGQFVFDGHLYK